MAKSVVLFSFICAIIYFLQIYLIIKADKIINTLLNEKNENYTSIQTTYFYFKKYSCISIYRDRVWFSQILPELYIFWAEVEQYRRDGIETHPKYKVKISTRIGAITKLGRTCAVIEKPTVK